MIQPAHVIAAIAREHLRESSFGDVTDVVAMRNERHASARTRVTRGRTAVVVSVVIRATADARRAVRFSVDARCGGSMHRCRDAQSDEHGDQPHEQRANAAKKSPM